MNEEGSVEAWASLREEGSVKDEPNWTTTAEWICVLSMARNEDERRYVKGWRHVMDKKHLVGICTGSAWEKGVKDAEAYLHETKPGQDESETRKYEKRLLAIICGVDNPKAYPICIVEVTSVSVLWKGRKKEDGVVFQSFLLWGDIVGCLAMNTGDKLYAAGWKEVAEHPEHNCDGKESAFMKGFADAKAWKEAREIEKEKESAESLSLIRLISKFDKDHSVVSLGGVTSHTIEWKCRRENGTTFMSEVQWTGFENCTQTDDDLFYVLGWKHIAKNKNTIACSGLAWEKGVKDAEAYFAEKKAVGTTNSGVQRSHVFSLRSGTETCTSSGIGEVSEKALRTVHDTFEVVLRGSPYTVDEKVQIMKECLTLKPRIEKAHPINDIFYVNVDGRLVIPCRGDKKCCAFFPEESLEVLDVAHESFAPSIESKHTILSNEKQEFKSVRHAAPPVRVSGAEKQTVTMTLLEMCTFYSAGLPFTGFEKIDDKGVMWRAGDHCFNCSWDELITRSANDFLCSIDQGPYVCGFRDAVCNKEVSIFKAGSPEYRHGYKDAKYYGSYDRFIQRPKRRGIAIRVEKPFKDEEGKRAADEAAKPSAELSLEAVLGRYLRRLHESYVLVSVNSVDAECVFYTQKDTNFDDSEVHLFCYFAAMIRNVEKLPLEGEDRSYIAGFSHKMQKVPGAPTKFQSVAYKKGAADADKWPKKKLEAEKPKEVTRWWQLDSGEEKLAAYVPSAAYLKRKRSASPHSWLERKLPEAFEALKRTGFHTFKMSAPQSPIEQEAMIEKTFNEEKGYNVSRVRDGFMVTMKNDKKAKQEEEK